MSFGEISSFTVVLSPATLRQGRKHRDLTKLSFQPVFLYTLHTKLMSVNYPHLTMKLIHSKEYFLEINDQEDLQTLQNHMHWQLLLIVVLKGNVHELHEVPLIHILTGAMH
eukprot:1006440_1